MKKFALLLFLILCMSLNEHAQEQSQTNGETIQVAFQKEVSNRPRSGSIISQVNCYYCGGMLYVDLNCSAEMVHISVTDSTTGELYETSGAGYNRSFVLSVPATSGEYYVEIEIDSSLLYGYYCLK